jgi:hypothetical protein
MQVIGDAVAKPLRGFAVPTAAGGSLEQVQSLSSEMEDSVNRVQKQLTQLVTQIMDNAMVKMQAEADWRADATLQKLVQMLNSAPEKDNDTAMTSSIAEVAPGRAAKISSGQGQQPPARAARPTWVEVTGMKLQATTGWTTVTNSNKILEKNHLDGYPGNIMFEVKKPLAHARAHVTRRLINPRYTEKGNSSAVVRENVCAENLLEFISQLLFHLMPPLTITRYILSSSESASAFCFILKNRRRLGVFWMCVTRLVEFTDGALTTPRLLYLIGRN